MDIKNIPNLEDIPNKFADINIIKGISKNIPKHPQRIRDTPQGCYRTNKINCKRTRNWFR